MSDVILPEENTLPWPEIEQRAGAAFLGMAIGDAMGATTEFMTPMEIQARYGTLKKIVGGGWLRLKPGQVTDDTEMSFCIAVGRMVHQALIGASIASLKIIANDLVANHHKFRFRPYPGKSSAYVVDTLQTVLPYFFSTDSIETCLIGVVNQGGDADTTGAIAGMIAGAFYGMDHLPRRWLQRLDRGVREEVIELADHLVNTTPLAARRKGKTA